MERNKSHDPTNLGGERPHPLLPAALHADQHLAGCDPQSKWGVPARLLTIPYLIAHVCVQLIKDSASGWLHLIVLWVIWNMLKMLWIGPISVVLLIRVRESVATRRGRASLTAEANDAEERAAVDAVGAR